MWLRVMYRMFRDLCIALLCIISILVVVLIGAALLAVPTALDPNSSVPLWLSRIGWLFWGLALSGGLVFWGKSAQEAVRREMLRKRKE